MFIGSDSNMKTLSDSIETDWLVSAQERPLRG